MEMQALKREVVRFSQRIWQRGWVANHDGNITVRLGGNRILATPTAFGKGDIREDDILVLDLETGKVLAGRHRPFSELYMHLEYYNSRSDVQAVIHAHPPTAGSFSIAGIEIETRIVAEAVVSLGDRIPLAPAVMPGSLESKQQIRSLGTLYDVIHLGNHGLVSCGVDLEMAYLRMELAEHLANMQKGAMELGRLELIPDEWVDELLAKRTKAGLGPEARKTLVGASIKDLSEIPAEAIIASLVKGMK